jgi:hypothetical protein
MYIWQKVMNMGKGKAKYLACVKRKRRMLDKPRREGEREKEEDKRRRSTCCIAREGRKRPVW